MSLALVCAACGASPIRVDGVMSQSAEMRPLQHVPPEAYRQLRVLVQLASTADAQGSRECGTTPLEGTSESEQRNNMACVPADAPNAAMSIVRQRLRAYGVQVARDASEPYDYTVELRVMGAAPRKADPMAARATARLTFRAKDEKATAGFFGSIDVQAATAAFPSVARDCALKDAELASFSSVASQPMNPQFDVMALAADVVDNSVGCEQLARFVHEAPSRFPRPAPPPPAPAPPATPPR